MSESYGDSCAARDLAHAGPRYRRALAIVVALNIGMGLAELAGGLLGTSQALKADALDFLGDGSITLLALLSLSWRPIWRARAALLQGGFLAALGVAVLAAAFFRVLVQKMPQHEFMSVLGVLALATNVGAALVLVPHRRGDSNIRAVWLFSRNDALGNAAVIVAGGLVYWTGTPWPDLVAAAVIAVLFLASSRTIVHESLAELRAAGAPATSAARPVGSPGPREPAPTQADTEHSDRR